MVSAEQTIGELIEGQRQINATMVATSRTIGELVEGQRQTNARLDRLESKMNKLVWLGFGIIGTTLSGAAATLIAAFARFS